MDLWHQLNILNRISFIALLVNTSREPSLISKYKNREIFRNIFSDVKMDAVESMFLLWKLCTFACLVCGDTTVSPQTKVAKTFMKNYIWSQFYKAIMLWWIIEICFTWNILRLCMNLNFMQCVHEQMWSWQTIWCWGINMYVYCLTLIQ